MKYLNFATRVLKEALLEFLIIIIDLSGSMDIKDWKPSRKAGAVKANKELIKVKAQNYPEDKVAIVGFGSNAEVLREPVCLRDGTESLYKSLRNLPDMGSTNFMAALELAEMLLFGKPFTNTRGLNSRSVVGFLSRLLYDQKPTSHYIRENSPSENWLRRIIILSDGDYNEGGSPILTARRLKDAGVIIDCIGIGGEPDSVKETSLKEIASRDPDGSIRYCFIGDQQELIKKYESLAHHIRPA